MPIIKPFLHLASALVFSFVQDLKLFSYIFTSRFVWPLTCASLCVSDYVWETHLHHYSVTVILNFCHFLTIVTSVILNSVSLRHAWRLCAYSGFRHLSLNILNTFQRVSSFLFLNTFSWIVTCALFWVCTLQTRCQIFTTKNANTYRSQVLLKIQHVYISSLKFIRSELFFCW
jgi:hypothetical protein